jgi:hypothetical protein
VIVDEPATDIEIQKDQCIVVDSVQITFAGRGGFEEAPEQGLVTA